MDGVELLNDLHDTLTRYVVFPDEHSSVATTLWITVTHALPAFDCAPRLTLKSPQKRCGKTRTLDVIAGTCHLPLAMSDGTVAAIFRSLGGAHPPTLIIDEADAIFGKKVAEQNEDKRALLNAGHQRGKPVLRCVGPHHEPTEFDVFAMAALAGIGDMPETITDRAINVTMRRRAPGEKVSQFRLRRDTPVLETLRGRLAAWASSQIETLTAAIPEMPVEDRAADTWEPLIAVVDAAGGDWPERARAACKALVAAAEAGEEEESQGIRLLVDIRQVFDDEGEPFLPSETLVHHLRGIREAPWNDFDLTVRKLAQRLRGFGIRPGHNTEKTARGYQLEDMYDSFRRYLRPKPSNRPETGDDQW